MWIYPTEFPSAAIRTVVDIISNKQIQERKQVFIKSLAEIVCYALKAFIGDPDAPNVIGMTAPEEALARLQAAIEEEVSTAEVIVKAQHANMAVEGRLSDVLENLKLLKELLPLIQQLVPYLKDFPELIAKIAPIIQLILSIL